MKGHSIQEMKRKLVSIQDYWINFIRLQQMEEAAGETGEAYQENMAFARQMLDWAVNSEVAVGKIRVNLHLPMENRSKMEEYLEGIENETVRLESILAANPNTIDELKEKIVSIQDAFLTYLNTSKPRSRPDADFERRIKDAAEVLQWAVDAEGILASMRVKIALKEGGDKEMLEALVVLRKQILDVEKGIF